MTSASEKIRRRLYEISRNNHEHLETYNFDIPLLEKALKSAVTSLELLGAEPRYFEQILDLMNDQEDDQIDD
jgi:hypothetical protein